MSRHRAVRNLDIDEVMDEDVYSDDYDENEYEGQLNDEDRQELEAGLSHVHSVVGEDVPVSDTEIKEALWYYYFDREETVNWVLEKVAKIKAEEEKQKKKAAKKAAAASKDVRVTGQYSGRKPRYRRPPAKLYADAISQQQLSPPPASSLQSLAQRAGVSSLAQKSTQKSPSLQSLAQRAAGQRGMSALQTLASRQQQRTTGAPSPAASPKPSSLAALAQKSSATKAKTSLTHLATRSRPTEVSAKAAPGQGLAGLARLASKQSSRPDAAAEIQKQPGSGQQKPVDRAETNDVSSGPTINATPPLRSSKVPANPLCAKPSAAADFLFMRMSPDSQQPTPAPIPAFNSIGQAFYDAVKTSADTIHVFSFDIPSPDDVVMKAQSHRSGGGQQRQS